MPIRIFWQDAQPMVDWGYVGSRRFTEPFFSQTVNACLRHPADVLFRPQTPLEELGEIAASQPGLHPTGFIFHMSRCGSTLVSQMLGAAEANLVLSEASPIDEILRAPFRHPEVTGAQHEQWLRWIVAALAWRRHSPERYLFIKFDCWHVRFLPLIQRTFPDVPWIFLYREPLEVMASAQKQLGGQMIPGVLEPGLFGWDASTVQQMALHEYTARVLGKLCEAALAEARSGRGKLVNYRQLPAAVWPALLRYWRADFSEDEMARMLNAALLNAKNPVLPFEEDSLAKRNSATPETRALTGQWLDGVYQQLETARLARGFA